MLGVAATEMGFLRRFALARVLSVMVKDSGLGASPLLTGALFSPSLAALVASCAAATPVCALSRPGLPNTSSVVAEAISRAEMISPSRLLFSVCGSGVLVLTGLVEGRRAGTLKSRTVGAGTG